MVDSFPFSPLLLIVGPDRRSRERYASCAAAADFRVEQAHDGLQALDKATTLRPDIILTDLSLSWGLDGLALCRRLGDAESTKGIPILAVAGERPTEVEEARAAGCTSVLVKPCSPERLLVEIIRVLSRTQRVGLLGEREDHHITVGFLTRSLWTALSKNARLTTENADLTASAELWADWYGQAAERARQAEAELRALRGAAEKTKH
ncbi:MAG TPA: response regulator [Vicinamibacterales bacterium]|jgi:CheY-like chemotaxis protein|nr:response regulator [Vicinamibacterales bacterium]